jgi:hypothetical protein
MNERSRVHTYLEKATTREEAVGLALGAASTCWKDTVVEEGKYGRPDKYDKVFDSEEALRIQHDLLEWLDSHPTNP